MAAAAPADGAGASDDTGACHAAVRTDLTRTHFRGFVRREEFWPEDSKEYRAGCDIENRKRPPPDEVPGDVFDRQRVICGFDQGLVERQVCLVLGAGGIGQDVALTLARLGVGKIILVDRDVYDAHNLTRQCLGCKADVGQRKVDVAARTLRERHCLCSDVEAVHCDAVLEWPRIVGLARTATAVFNAIDVGVMWDYCVNSLCKELGLPLACGQSFGWKFMTELYTGSVQDVCAFCYDSTLSTFAASETSVRRKGGVLDRMQGFLAMQGDSATSIGAEVLVSFLAHDRQFGCVGGALCQEVVEGAFERAGLQELQRASLGEHLLRFLQGLHGEVTARLLPGRIGALPDVAFIPRPSHADTRHIGSWVCPCLGCAVMMVSQWAALLTAPAPEAEGGGEAAGREGVPRRRSPPQTVTFNLDLGMTGEEQMAYELGALGMVSQRAQRRFACEASSAACSVCSAAAGLRAEEALFVGRCPVVLSPVPGEAIPPPASWHEPLPAGDESGRLAEALRRVTARSQPLAHLGEDYMRVVVPAMPALDWERGDGDAPPLWPPELSTMPLLKVPASSDEALHPSALRGVASGVRSALVKVRGQWWRLKGCGNRDEAFPVEAKGAQGELSVRGSCFQHTTEAELRMTELAGAALARAGLDCANTPAGSYRYAPAPNWPLPKVERYCGVFQTLGNARLGDHLLAGLLLLMPALLPDPGDGFAALRCAVVSGRGAEPGEIWPTSMTTSCGLPTADVASQLRHAGVRLLEVAPPASFAMSQPVPPAYAGLWDGARAKLAEVLARMPTTGKDEPSLLLWLAWRLGWECGSTVRCLHAAGIAWGTYPDAMGIHCNAHINNFVVKPPGSGSSPTTFLAALDFDMAFTRDSYLPEAVVSHSGLGLDTWEGVLNFEATMGMRLVLSGSDFASTGVVNAAAVPESHRNAEVALRDTLVAAYEAAREGATDTHPHDPALHEGAYALIRLALCLTADVEA